MAKTKADIQAQIEKLQAEMNAMNEKKKDVFCKAIFTDEFADELGELSDADVKALAAYLIDSSKDFVKKAVEAAKKAEKAVKPVDTTLE